jgi:predicted SprT family Zn-dependent metalloprotease
MKNYSHSHNVTDALTMAYDHFNQKLFNNSLDSCIIHMHRKAKCYGYFAGGRFGTTDTGVNLPLATSQSTVQKVDEIALNPSHFATRTLEQSLSTLVHEMVHLWQHHKGNPGRGGYHNKEWAEYMVDVGLMPSDTGLPGGKQTGQKVSHYIIEGGDFQTVCAELLAGGFTLPYIELWSTDKPKTVRAKAASKTKYVCPSCQANAWAKPGASLICGTCREDMEAVA